MLNTSRQRRYHSNTLHQMLSFPWPLTPPIPNIGGVMQQKSGDHWPPLGFFSRKLTDTESHYSTFDRKLLAAHAAIKKKYISVIFAKVELFNFGQIKNRLLLPFQPPFHPDNNAIWHSFQNLMCNYCIYRV